MGPAPLAGLRPGQAHHPSRGWAITTILPNLWLENYVTGAFPFVFQPLVTARPAFPLNFQDSVVPLALPPVYHHAGAAALFPSAALANTPMTCSDSRTIWLLSRQAIRFNYSRPSAGSDFRNGYIRHGHLGIDQEIGSVKLSASYVATAGVHLASVLSPNGYGGADPAFAPIRNSIRRPCHRRLRP